MWWMAQIPGDRPHGKPERGQSLSALREGERFFAGPIPLRWLEEAARLPGKTLHAGIALWFAAGLAKSAKIPLSNISGCRFGLDRNSKYRALEWLEGARLISVVRRPGKTPMVTILDVEHLS
jgi:hypothetical protein